jgi:hypothetical protein
MGGAGPMASECGQNLSSGVDSIALIELSMHVHAHILILHPSANHKGGAVAKSVKELHQPMFSQLPPLACGGDALQKPLCVFRCNCWTFHRPLLAIEDDDRWLTHVQPQFVCAIGVNQLQQVVHRIHGLNLKWAS